ncbi:MAG: hypothetical protein COB20_00630 [SAR86 cluster bacterium]|uniref:Uncharacterized protein n=1 Tax=SAR86 cluster bacterium TaxID=2030880 RepID=A0A2A4XI20_9GAMM|nr:MAG: hypothetical protein COB20_00630 [SAR86 cluster bacterium]
MSTPAPVRLIEYALNRFSYPVPTVGAIVGIPLFTLFVISGGFRPMPEYDLWNRPMEIMGVFLLLAILPAGLLMWFTAWVRSSESLFSDIHSQVPQSSESQMKRYRLGKYWPIAVVLGTTFAILGNINGSSLSLDSESEIFVTSAAIAFGQIFMWSIVAVTLLFVFNDDLLLYQYGKSVRVNIYNLDRLNGFGRAALSQFLMVIGALALTTLQSLDRDFQWVNYANGLYVGIPSAIIFVLLPTWTIRKNIRREKAQALASINTEIQLSSTGLDNESLVRLNGLIARRDQVQHTRTWPMDISIFSRFLFYIFIPPLAWLGAALMEVMLDSFLAG